MSSALPEGWEYSTIRKQTSKIIDNRGKTPPLSETGSEMIEVACISGNKKFVDYEQIRKYVSKDVYDTWFRNGHPIVGDILVPTVGSLGQFAMMKENRGCIAQNIIAVRPIEKTNNNFLYYSFNSQLVLKEISAVLMGAVQPSLKVPHFMEIEIPIPPLPEQEKIAAVLGAVDDVIEKTALQIKKLNDLKKSTMNELLTRGIGHTDFKPSELGQIPKSWNCMVLGEIADVTKLAGYEYTSHFDYSIGGSIIAIRALNLKGGKLNLDDIQTIPIEVSKSLPRSKLYYGELLISYVGTVGEIGFVDSNDKYHLAPNVAKITPIIRAIEPRFLLQQMLSEAAQKSIKNLSSVTSQPSINMANIRLIPIKVPPKEEQKQIASILDSISTQIEKVENKLSSLNALKKSLMQDLLSGKVRVRV